MVVEFANHKVVEERVVCLADEWRGSVLLLSIYKENPKRWRERAERCPKYQVAAMPNVGLVNE